MTLQPSSYLGGTRRVVTALTRAMFRLVLLVTVALSVLLSACASTKAEYSGMPPSASLCQSRGEKLTALVLWGPIWRPNQKDVPLREQAARQGLEQFFTTSKCFTAHELRRLPGGSSAAVPSDPELLALAATASPPPDRVIVVTLRELGPIVKLLGSLALVEGGTEVVLGLTVINVHTGASLARYQIHWRNGGAMVIKGVATLPQDMSAAMEAAMSPTLHAMKEASP